MMRNYFLGIILGVALMFSGCAVMDSILIPEEGRVKSDTVVVVDGVTTGLVATGNPIAVPALALSGILSVVAGIYTNLRKKQKLVAADDKYENTLLITEAIVKAIEETGVIKVGGVTLRGEPATIGGIIKDKVESKLKDKDAYVIGKAIITALKARE
jgi:hypothetical protein